MKKDLSLEHAIEALLFWRGEPVALKELMKSLEAKEEAVHEALVSLAENLKGRGIILMANGEGEYMLGTSVEASDLIEKLTKEELSKDLGKASLETLSIIMYKGPIKRSQIDYVRGVNSTFILRNLLIRGLIEKKPAPDDARTSIYSPSFKLLSHLGVSKIEDLPNFELVKNEIEKFNTENTDNPDSGKNTDSDSGQGTKEENVNEKEN